MKGEVHAAFCDSAPLDLNTGLGPILRVCREHDLSVDPGVDTPPSTETVSIDGGNQLRLFVGDEPVQLYFGISDYWQGPAGSVLDVITDADMTLPCGEQPDGTDAGGTDWFIEFACDLALELDPLLVSTWNTIHRGEIYPLSKDVLPLETPIESDLQRVPWLGVYSDPFVDQFGGKERVLEAPAWKVEELDNGSVLVVTTRFPWEDYKSKLPADRYLLDGCDDV